MKNIKKNKGSILVFSLFVMMISLMVGISLMSTSSIGRKSTLSTSKTINSFQVADSGIEYAFYELREYKINNGVLNPNVNILDVFPSCVNSSKATVIKTVNEGEFELNFINSSGNPISSCSGAVGLIDNVKRIRAIGTYNNITRSVEADVNLTAL